MAKFSEMYGGTFLTAADLPAGREISLMVDHVQPEKLEDAVKLVVYFVGKTKGLVLNKTNGSVLASAYGDETDVWTGKTVVLFRTQTMFGGKMVDALRLRIPASDKVPLSPTMAPLPPVQPQPQPVQQPPRYDIPTDQPPDDDCPF